MLTAAVEIVMDDFISNSFVQKKKKENLKASPDSVYMIIVRYIYWICTITPYVPCGMCQETQIGGGGLGGGKRDILLALQWDYFCRLVQCVQGDLSKLLKLSQDQLLEKALSELL